jgi:chromosome segregation ATPase
MLVKKRVAKKPKMPWKERRRIAKMNKQKSKRIAKINKQIAKLETGIKRDKNRIHLNQHSVQQMAKHMRGMRASKEQIEYTVSGYYEGIANCSRRIDEAEEKIKGLKGQLADLEQQKQ